MRKWDQEPKKPHATAYIDRRQLILGTLTLLCMAALMIVGLTPRTANAPDADPPAAQAGSDATALMTKDCQIIQTLTYTPCGHEITRRQSLPEELVGKGRTALETTYDQWQITSFAPAEVRMVQALDMHCPEHLVLMPDDSGTLCVFRNKYGDALALVSEMNILLEELPDAVQEELRPGKGFSTQEEIDLWLEANDS